jgi:hypothetical protein
VFLSHFQKEKRDERERERKPFSATLADLLFLGLLFLCCSLFGSCHLASIRYRFLLLHVVPAAAAAVQRIPVRHFRCFPFFFFTLCRTDYLIVSLFVSFIFFTSTVYVFLGEPHNLYDFMTTMQMMRLFTKGEYMVISVDWETYSPDRAREYLWS